jgi:spore coat polysaccharide biosynthesis protein SpsF
MKEIFKKEDNIVAIIQARMCSTRLPGKVMKDISGKPMLWHVIYRVKYSKLINKIVVATSTNKEDDIIENFCKENRILFYRGDEEDVLKRYYEAAKIYNGNKIVRITSDCPLIDPEIVDIVIKEHLKDGVDYTSNTIERTFPRGLDTEVFNFETLERANEMAKEKYQREHVTIFIYENPHLFKIKNVRNFKDLSHLRWTVDEEKDLIFVREIYKRLYKGNIFFMRDILEVLEKEPDLKRINEMVKQKPVK